HQRAKLFLSAVYCIPLISPTPPLPKRGKGNAGLETRLPFPCTRVHNKEKSEPSCHPPPPTMLPSPNWTNGTILSPRATSKAKLRKSFGITVPMRIQPSRNSTV